MEHGGVLIPLSMFVLVGVIGRLVVAMAASRMWRGRNSPARVRIR